MNGRKDQDLLALENARKDVSNVILKAKEDYYLRLGAKLNDPMLAKKSYWSIVKTLFNGKKIPVIPPIFSNNQIITDFQTKANIFNEHFSNQCTVISNNSVFPVNFQSLTNDELISIDIREENILKIIRNLNSAKAHGYDAISIAMLKICDISVSKPLCYLFKNPISNNLISLLQICSKIFERLIYNSIFNFIQEIKLLSPNQSGFKSIY